MGIISKEDIESGNVLVEPWLGTAAPTLPQRVKRLERAVAQLQETITKLLEEKKNGTT